MANSLKGLHGVSSNAITNRLRQFITSMRCILFLEVNVTGFPDGTHQVPAEISPNYVTGTAEC
jgi:hypothetical protein